MDEAADQKESQRVGVPFVGTVEVHQREAGTLVGPSSWRISHQLYP